MPEYHFNQSAWGRARQDTIIAFHKISLWMAEMISAPIVAVGMFFAVPDAASSFAKTVAPIAAFAIWMLAMLGGVFLLSLVVAPYRQRNEARSLLQAKPKPIPLQNRNELKGAIASIENTTMQLITRWAELDKMYEQSPYLGEAMATADEAYDRWNESMNELRRQYLIAGKAYEGVCLEFTGFIAVQVGIKMGHIKPAEDTVPIILQDMMQFVRVLGGRVAETLQRIDEISGQAPDKEDSQNE